MKLNKRVSSGVGLLVLAAAVLVGVAPARTETKVPEGALSAVDYADKMSWLVKSRKIDELTKLDVPQTAATAKLFEWKSQYLTTIQKSEAQRDKQYADAVAKAEDYQKRGKLDEAMDKVVAAYQIAKSQEEFLKLPWVTELTEKVATKASDLEKQGQWIESLQLYSDLNSLFEISTKYKADMQRLARRTRLLAMYTPKTLFEMRKAALAKQERDKDKTETQPKEDEETTPPSFPKWQDHVENITIEMLRDACDKAVADWVEKTNYSKLLGGGAEAMRLFLSTPQLSQEFPAIKDEAACRDFATALDAAIRAAEDPGLSSTDFHTQVLNILDANSKTIKLPPEVAIMEFTDGAMEKLDPFTTVVWPQEVKEFDKNVRGYFGGVGIQISLENGLLKVISPLEDTPAFKAGIAPGDVITAIDGKSTVGISIDQAVRSIMGKPGTDVTLKVKREGLPDQKEYKITRAEIRVTSVKGVRRDMTDPENPKWDFMLDRENRIGYIRVTGFQEDTTRDLENALMSLQEQKAQGVILDLRFNPGGLLQAAIEISDMFLEQGVIVSTKGPRTGRNAATAHRDTVVPMSLPMVVLVNQYSASASEIFAGAMKDHHRALIVGQRTFGKGSVQNLVSIGSGTRKALIKLTMSYYYLPEGESLHRRDGDKKWGVDPDVQVDLTPKQLAELLKQRRDSEIIHRNAKGDATPAPSTTSAPATQHAENGNGNGSKDPVLDTQLDTGLLMLRLQLVQPKG